MGSFPVMLRLEGKRAVIVGGGKVAARKIRSLLNTGAEIEIVSPSIESELHELKKSGAIIWRKKTFEASDITDAFIVVAATNNKDINRYVASHCQPFQLINVVSEPGLGNFTLPAVLKRGKLTIAVSTEGGSPLLAKKIRDELAETYGEEYKYYLDTLTKKRQKIITAVQDPCEKKKLLQKLIQ